MKLLRILSLVLAVFLSSAAFAEEEPVPETKIAASGLPLPRFASLRSDEINLRTGPGTRYPIEWVLKREGLPVEITAEYDIWRRIRDSEGTEGWVHKMALSGKRSAVVTGEATNLRKRAREDAQVIAHLEKDSVGQLLSCEKEWCKLKFDGIKGYLPKATFWGATSNEVFD